MPAIQRTVFESLNLLSAGLGRAQDHVAQAVQLASHLQHDYRVAPAERLAIALITTTGRVAGEWLHICAELRKAEDTLEEAHFDLRLLEARLERGDVSDGLLDFEDEALVPSMDSEALA